MRIGTLFILSEYVHLRCFEDGTYNSCSVYRGMNIKSVVYLSSTLSVRALQCLLRLAHVVALNYYVTTCSKAKQHLSLGPFSYRRRNLVSVHDIFRE